MIPKNNLVPNRLWEKAVRRSIKEEQNINFKINFFYFKVSLSSLVVLMNDS